MFNSNSTLLHPYTTSTWKPQTRPQIGLPACRRPRPVSYCSWCICDGLQNGLTWNTNIFTSIDKRQPITSLNRSFNETEINVGDIMVAVRGVTVTVTVTVAGGIAGIPVAGLWFWITSHTAFNQTNPTSTFKSTESFRQAYQKWSCIHPRAIKPTPVNEIQIYI